MIVRRFAIACPLAVAEVQRRLAVATADWVGDWRGVAIPPPPWGDAEFSACPGKQSFWCPIALVVEGRVEPTADGSVISGRIRPHLADLWGFGAAVVVPWIAAYLGGGGGCARGLPL